TLHVKYALLILHETRNKLRDFPNVRKTTTSITNQITICGDLHGSYEDLMIIFEKNSAPSCDNPYIFNGDLVDRGPCSIEIILVIFAFFLLYPNHVFINRGNHEDHIMNSRYGFSKEVIKKYKSHASKIIRVVEDVFSWLTLATVVDNEILVVHGGVSDITDLQYVDNINRHKYTSVLKPDFLATNRDNIDYDEWRQVLDLLWSDPLSKPGCTVNSYRGGGCYFGPDVTKKVLERHGLKLIVRSHECCLEGHDSTHGGKVLTVFSASDYYEKGSNKGAYMKILPNLKPYFVEYTGMQCMKKFNFVERISRVEESALRELRKLIFSQKDSLLQEFRKYDTEHTGLITVLEWTNVMERVLEICLPWSMIRKQISVGIKDGKVDYESCLDQYQIEAMFSKKGNFIEALYRHRNTFETIFRVMDKNNSGMVSLDEFEECCRILCEHTKCMSEQDVQDLARTLDINQDGFIDFNEFLEAFRLSENSSNKN
ncbi:serine threonine- phosphatase with EF-hands 2-like, partial [Paramuricea clavata]